MCPDLRYLPSEKEFKEYDFIAHVYIQKDELYKTETIGNHTMRVGILEIQILELFKGDSSKHILEFDKFTSCELGIEANEEWILFSKKGKDGQLTIGACDYVAQYRNQKGERYPLDERGIKALSKLKKFYNHNIKEYRNKTVKSYYKNGQIELVENYKKGELHGERKIWYPNGQILSASNYNRGQRNGAFIEYFENGQISSECLFYNDKRIGISKIYFELDSQRIQRILYQEFGTIDTCNFLYNTIIIEFERIYDHEGMCISDKNYDRFGNIKSEIHYFPDDTITHIYYYQNGQISSVSHSKKGKSYGRYQSFDKNGLPDNDNSWDYDDDGERIKNK